MSEKRDNSGRHARMSQTQKTDSSTSSSESGYGSRNEQSVTRLLVLQQGEPLSSMKPVDYYPANTLDSPSHRKSLRKNTLWAIAEQTLGCMCLLEHRGRRTARTPRSRLLSTGFDSFRTSIGNTLLLLKRPSSDARQMLDKVLELGACCPTGTYGPALLYRSIKQPSPQGTRTTGCCVLYY